MRKVSADFCAAAGATPSRTAPRIAPSFTIRMSLSLIPGSSQVTLYHRGTAAGHGLRRLDAAALDCDAAARMKAAARRDIGGIGQRVAEADIRHAASRLGREHACEQRLRVGVAGCAEERLGFVTLDDAAEIHDGNFARDMLDHR